MRNDEIEKMFRVVRMRFAHDVKELMIFDHNSVSYWKNSCYKIHDLDSFLRHVSEI